MMLHLQSVPPRNGLIWVRHGLKVVQRQPFALVGLFSLIMLVWTLLGLTGIGSLLTVGSVPLVSLGFMLASHQVLQSHTPTVHVFTQPLQLTPERRKAQLLLALLCIVLSIVISQIAVWVAGGAFDQLADLAKSGKTDQEAVVAALLDPRLVDATLTFFGLLAVVSVPLWHAPALIHWGGQGVIQSLFSSTLGVWKNKGAFMVAGLAWMGLSFGTSIVVSLLAAVLRMPLLGPLLQVPVFFVLFTAFLCSMYFTFIDCFMFGAPKDLSVPPVKKAGAAPAPLEPLEPLPPAPGEALPSAATPVDAPQAHDVSAIPAPPPTPEAAGTPVEAPAEVPAPPAAAPSPSTGATASPRDEHSDRRE